MSRKPTKKNEIESWLHAASGTTLTIYYDRSEQDFWCQVGAAIVSAPTQRECRRKSVELADETLHDEKAWRQVIFMSVENPRGQAARHGHGGTHNSPRVGFSIQRSWVMDAVVNGKPRRFTREWLRVPAPPEDSSLEFNYRRQKQRHDVCDFWLSVGDAVEIPYTEATWQNLLSMSAALEAVRERLASMVTTPEFREALAAGTANLLSGGGA